MSFPITLLIDTSGEETTTRAIEMAANRYTCKKHGDIGSRVFSLTIKDGQNFVSIGVICVECFANMLRCCRAEPDVPEKDEGIER